MIGSSELDGFLKTIKASPDDDAPKLVFADWLEEHGYDTLAELFRIRCEQRQFPVPEDVLILDEAILHFNNQVLYIGCESSNFDVHRYEQIYSQIQRRLIEYRISTITLAFKFHGECVTANAILFRWHNPAWRTHSVEFQVINRFDPDADVIRRLYPCTDKAILLELRRRELLKDINTRRDYEEWFEILEVLR